MSGYRKLAVGEDSESNLIIELPVKTIAASALTLMRAENRLPLDVERQECNTDVFVLTGHLPCKTA